MEKWKCPHCDHVLEFGPGHDDVVELAIESHMRRQHGAQEPVCRTGDHAPSVD